MFILLQNWHFVIYMFITQYLLTLLYLFMFFFQHYFNVKGEGDTNNFEAVNVVLNTVLHHSDCRWISLTTANNAYGSEVVQRVLKSAPFPVSKNKRQADLLLAPMDSKYYGKQGIIIVMVVQMFTLFFIV